MSKDKRLAPPQRTYAVSLRLQDLEELARLVAERASHCDDDAENARYTAMLIKLHGIIGRLRVYEKGLS